MVSIWDRWSSRKEQGRWKLLPPIIPVIFSHGPRPWTYPLDFSRLVCRPKGLDLAACTPQFSALLVDLAHRDEADLGRDRVVRVLLQVLKHIQAADWDRLAPALKAVHELGLSARPRGLVEAVLTYLLRARHRESARSILDALPSDELRREAMTIADRLERKGRREGRVGDKREVLERHLDRKFGLTEEERKLIRAEADPKKLDAALDAVLFADTKRAVLGHLRSTDRSKARQ